MDYGDTVDEWTEDSDEDFCYGCDDWTQSDDHDNCSACGNKYTTVDPFIHPSSAKVYSSPAPKVSAHGDVWSRGSGYTWGGGGWFGGGTSMWGGGWSSSQTDREARLLKHKRHLDSLCKVVDPTVKHILNYSTSGSYSDINNNKIFVDGSLLEQNDDNLDVVAGLSIHEKLHLVHTKPLLKWERDFRVQHNLSGAESRLIHSIANIIEDEYIESQLAKSHAGYVSYIQKVKEHYFSEHGQDLDECKNQFGDVLNTFLAMVRFPESITTERRKKHAKHIQFFARAIKNALDSREDSLTSIEAVYHYMRQLAVEEAERTKESDTEKVLERATEKLDEILSTYEESGVDNELSTDDIQSMLDRLIENELAEAKRMDRFGEKRVMDKGIDAHSGELADYDRLKDTITDSLSQAIRDLEDSDYEESEYKGDKALGLRHSTKVTWVKQRSNDTNASEYEAGVSRVKPHISSLKKRIQLYGDTKIHTIRNQRRGKLDKKMLHKIPLGRQDLFKNVIIDEDKPLDVCLLVDESGSMGYGKMRHARDCAIALRESLKDNQALNLWVFGHTADGYDWDSLGTTNMSVYWSPTYQTDMKAMGAMRARSENRDGIALLASADKVKSETPSMSSNKLMIVISDGEPSADKYRGDTASSHTKKCVRHLESQGWNIIQLGIQGSREWRMKDMFTNYIYLEDTSQLSNQVSRIIRKVIKV